MDTASVSEQTESVHIGALIKAKMKEEGLSAAWLARHLACDRTNIYKLFNRKSLDTDTLMKISLALHFNFFSLYTKVFKQTTS